MTPAGHEFLNVAWPRGSDELVVTYRTASRPNNDPLRLYGLQPDGSGLRPLLTEDDPGCPKTSRVGLQSLPDGRVGYLQTCRPPPEGRRGFADERALMAFDPATGDVRRLVPYLLARPAFGFSFSPDMRVGIIAGGDPGRRPLSWLFADRQEPVDLPLHGATTPSWSPDGRLIAIAGVADPRTRPVPGAVSGNGLPRKIYLFAPDGTSLRALTEDEIEARVIGWSPDSRWLAVVTEERKQYAYWLLQMATGQRYRLGLPPRYFSSLVWSPDGRHLAATVGATQASTSRQPQSIGLYIYDLPDLNQFTTVGR